ncbi:MAG: SDR family oxidoreductase [Phycisphaeraceae bacterium]|nr:SDR family oxidoreductase [Phycisphaeraceae bacterium]
MTKTRMTTTMTTTTKTTKTAPKLVLVTGGARRVGQAVALAMAQAGWDVAITYRTSAAEAKQTAAAITKLGRRALPIRADHADPSAPKKIIAQIRRRFGRLDALVNNAAIFSRSRLGQISPAEFDRYLAVNARGPLLLIQACAPLLAARKPTPQNPCSGKIVNLLDIHVLGQPMRGYLAYNASKAALLEITRSCAIELAPQITVNAIAPGVVAWADSYSTKDRRQYLKRVPLARPGSPADVAKAVRFLLEDADYCTGQIIHLDGGRLLS